MEKSAAHRIICALRHNIDIRALQTNENEHFNSFMPPEGEALLRRFTVD
jgi:hypothetical protein